MPPPRTRPVGSRTCPASPGSPVAPDRFDKAPAVCRAGEFQFAPHQTHINGCVQSRALFWCKSGRGRFYVNGQAFTLEPHDLYVLPWNRHIEYVAGARQPMFTAHVHIVPWLRPGATWEANVPHERDEPLFDSPDRADVAWSNLSGVVHLHIETEAPLGRLINYITQWFRHSPRLEDEGRALGLLVVRELARLAHTGRPAAARRPEELTRMLVHIGRCFREAPSVEQLAGILGRSRSHVLKLFQRFLHVSAKSYILGRQMREARELLVSTTLPISEVGQSSGFPDPYHFSKLFRRTVGMSPTEYRLLKGPLPASKEPSTHLRAPLPPKGEEIE